MRKLYLNNESNRKEKFSLFYLFGLIILFALIGFFAYTRIINNSVVIKKLLDAPMDLLVYVDGEEEEGFPPKSAGYIFDSITCKNDSSGTWDNATWSLDMNFIEDDACIIYFIKAYRDEVLSGADPVLDSKMVPVNIAVDGTITVADTTKEWYSYENSEWANVVLLNTYRNTTPGEVLDLNDDVAHMYVWIPRYSYDPDSIETAAHTIDITFVDKTKPAHPAFTFGDVEQSGFWMGKFEMGFVSGQSESTANVEYIIKPNVNSVHSTNVSIMYDKINNSMNTYLLDSTTDVHMLKNIEWGAVAYLSQSKYGICNSDGTCTLKVENNNYMNSSNLDIVTGCGGSDNSSKNSLSGVSICPVTNRWETANGVKASTTHNVTGVYDMAAGRTEYVMANMRTSSGAFNTGSSGFTVAPDAKYYDSYAYGTSTSDFSRGLTGDATIELYPTGLIKSNWNNDNGIFVGSGGFWFVRGGPADNDANSGIWNFYRYVGSAYADYSSRGAISYLE